MGGAELCGGAGGLVLRRRCALPGRGLVHVRAAAQRATLEAILALVRNPCQRGYVGPGTQDQAGNTLQNC